MEPEISTLWNIREKVGHEQERIVLKNTFSEAENNIFICYWKGKKYKTKQKQSKGSWSQLIHIMAYVYIDFLDFLNIGTVEVGLCDFLRLIE